jgi:acetolactate decarboxylase
MKQLFFTLCVTLFTASACSAQPASPEIIYQISRLDDLSAGNFDGKMTFGALKRFGNFGLGTFNGLNGEMICLDGAFFQVKDDGAAYHVKGGLKTPFANLTEFEADIMVTPDDDSMDLVELLAFLNNQIPASDGYYAIKIEGRFQYVKTRSVHHQIHPYPYLADVVAEQVTFEYEELEGTMVGFRFPEAVGGSNVIGYHFHFIDKDKKRGGHLLDCRTGEIAIEMDQSDGIQIVKSKIEGGQED